MKSLDLGDTPLPLRGNDVWFLLPLRGLFWACARKAGAVPVDAADMAPV